MSFNSVLDMLQDNVSRPRFCKSRSLGETWKSKSMRVIPEDFLRSTAGAFEHRLVFLVSWGNSWQLWLNRDKKAMVMEEEDWDEFVDDNFLGPNDGLIFTHRDTMFVEVKIYRKDMHFFKEIISAPLEAEPEAEVLNTKPQTSHQKTPCSAFGFAPFASASASFFASASASASGARQGSAPVKNPEKYLLNPNNPYFVKTLSKKIDVLYVSHAVIEKYDLKFGPHKSPMHYILPKGETFKAFTKIYRGNPCFNGWTAVCRKYNKKEGDNVVCELERSEQGVVTAVRVHFVVNE